MKNYIKILALWIALGGTACSVQNPSLSEDTTFAKLEIFRVRKLPEKFGDEYELVLKKDSTYILTYRFKVNLNIRTGEGQWSYASKNKILLIGKSKPGLWGEITPYLPAINGEAEIINRNKIKVQRKLFDKGDGYIVLKRQ